MRGTRETNRQTNIIIITNNYTFIQQNYKTFLFSPIKTEPLFLVHKFITINKLQSPDNKVFSFYLT